MDGCRCDVEFLGVRSTTVDTFLATDMFARILAARPDCVFLYLRGNSLDTRSTSPVMVALDILRLARRLLESGVKCVCVGQVCRRLRSMGHVLQRVSRCAECVARRTCSRQHCCHYQPRDYHSCQHDRGRSPVQGSTDVLRLRAGVEADWLTRCDKAAR